MMDSLPVTTVDIAERKQSQITVAGVILAALAAGGGVWWGLSEAGKLAPSTSLSTNVSTSAALPAAKPPTSASSASSASPAAAVTSGIVAGEVLIPSSTSPKLPGAQPATTALSPRPPEVFDPIAVMALQAEAKAVKTPTLPASLSPAVPASALEVQAAGWGGQGSAIEQLWESNAAAGWAVRPTPLSAPNWRISGLVQRGGQTQVIVQFDGDPTSRFFKIGDVLPGGAKLAWVKPDVIGVVLDRQKPLAVPVMGGPPESSQSAASAPQSPAQAKAKR